MAHDPNARMRRSRPAILLFGSLLTCCLATSLALGLPRLIPFQGRITDESNVPIPDGPAAITFNIYEEATPAPTTGPTPLPKWSESHPNVAVQNGQVNVILGSRGSSLDSLDFKNKSYYLGIRIGSASELAPRQELIPSFHARFSDSAISVADNGVSGPAIQGNTITSTKILDGEVKSADIGTGEVKADEIDANAVTTDEIANNTIKSEDIENGSITAADLAPGVIAPSITIAARIRLNAPDGSIAISNGAAGLTPKDVVSDGTSGGPAGGEFSYQELAANVATKLACENGVTSAGGTNPCGGSRESVGMVFNPGRTGKYEVCADTSVQTFLYLLRDQNGWRPSGYVNVKMQLVETAPNSTAAIQSGELQFRSIDRYWTNTPAGDGIQFNDVAPVSWCDIFNFASVGERAIRLFAAADVGSGVSQGRPCDNAGCFATLLGSVRMTIREIPQ